MGMQKRYNILFVLPLLTMVCGCEKFEPSPNQIFNEDSPQHINERQIQRLLSNRDGDDTIRVIFTGDSQRYYDEAELLVNKANSIPNIDFLILAGDLSDFGLRKEFEWI